MKHQYCPVCGHQLTGYFDYTIKVKMLLMERSNRTEKLIRKLFITIQKYNPEDVTLFNSYKFLQRLKDVESEKIRRVINQFFLGEYAQKMYGLKYIIGWIEKFDSTYDRRKIVEQKIHGSSPKTRIITYKPIKTIATISNSPALDKLRKK